MKCPDRRTLLLLGATALALLPSSLPGSAQKSGAEHRLEPHTVILVRHAEKQLDGDPRDPELTPAGRERATALARLLSHSGVTRLVSSEYKRTQATLAPLAESTGLSIDTRPARELEALADELLAAEPGSVTVVSGHSNTIPALAAQLGAPLANVENTSRGPMLDEGEYDRLFVLHLPPQGASVRAKALELRFGD